MYPPLEERQVEEAQRAGNVKKLWKDRRQVPPVLFSAFCLKGRPQSLLGSEVMDVLPKNGVVLVFLGCGGENIPGWEAVWPIMAKREGS